MTRHRVRSRPFVRLLLAAAMTLAGFHLLGSTPASAWCSGDTSYGSGLKSYGEETYRGATCVENDNIYSGQVRDSPTVSDGYCAHIRLNSGGGWFTQAYACSSSWVNYTVYNANAYSAMLCKGTTSVCGAGSVRGA